VNVDALATVANFLAACAAGCAHAHLTTIITATATATAAAAAAGGGGSSSSSDGGSNTAKITPEVRVVLFQCRGRY
jgi:hypothetical protein